MKRIKINPGQSFHFQSEKWIKSRAIRALSVEARGFYVDLLALGIQTESDFRKHPTQAYRETLLMDVRKIRRLAEELFEAELLVPMADVPKAEDDLDVEKPKQKKPPPGLEDLRSFRLSHNKLISDVLFDVQKHNPERLTARLNDEYGLARGILIYAHERGLTIEQSAMELRESLLALQGESAFNWLSRSGWKREEARDE